MCLPLFLPKDRIQILSLILLISPHIFAFSQLATLESQKLLFLSSHFSRNVLSFVEDALLSGVLSYCFKLLFM